MTSAEPRTARARARLELTASIKAVAGRHLAEDGAPGLSLRAVARELGLSSSAVYRYFPSRDHLLTALIIDAYDGLGTAVETAEAAAPRHDHAARWLAAARAVRAWAIANPHEYALIYGSPVPGYRAPQDTIGPATRAALAMASVVTDALADGALATPPGPPVPHEVAHQITALTDLFGDAPPLVGARALRAWATVFGLVSFELFGQFTNVLADPASFFDHAAAELGTEIGLVHPGSQP